MSKRTFEFVVQGPPYSANNDTSKPKTDWKQAVGLAAYKQWIVDGRSDGLLPLIDAMEVYVTTYCRNVLYDVDNVLKWTLDGLNAKERPRRFSNNKQAKIADTYKSIYEDDKQIYKLTSERMEAETWTQLASENVSQVIYEAIDKYSSLDKPGEFMNIVFVWEESEV